MTDPKKTLRDEFAMAALIAMGLPPADMTMGNTTMACRRAYAWADELMEARECPKGQLEMSKVHHKF